jgi:hypothetical protein
MTIKYYKNTEANFPKLLTAKEVAELTGMTQAALQGQRQRGIGLPYMKIGHFVRYNYDDVLLFFSENTIYHGL